MFCQAILRLCFHDSEGSLLAQEMSIFDVLLDVIITASTNK